MSNLAKRLLTAAVGVPILLALIYPAPPWLWAIFVMMAAAVASRELYQIVAPDSRRMPWVGTLGSWAIMAPLIFFPGNDLVVLSVIAALPLVALLAWLANPGDMVQVPHRAGLLALGLLYTGVLPTFVVLLRYLPQGSHLIVLVLSIAFLGDTGAYFAGRFLGRHQLYPAVSPKKTWEGAIGGLAASAGAVAFAHFYYLPDLPLGIGLALGATLGAMGQAGDLCESMLKRAYGVKDSGRLLPGHGGLLDRIDALLFAAPGLYLAIRWLGLGS